MASLHNLQEGELSYGRVPATIVHSTYLVCNHIYKRSKITLNWLDHSLSMLTGNLCHAALYVIAGIPKTIVLNSIPEHTVKSLLV